MKKLIALASTTIAIILMMTHYSAIMVWSPAPKQRVIETASYFDMIVLGYGNWFPMLTGVFAVFSLLIMLYTVTCFNVIHTKSKLSIVISIIAVINAFLSLLLFNALSVIGIIIAVLLLISTILQISLLKKNY